jgi:hypothetical protein
MGYGVAASSEWTDPAGVRRPVGEAHARTPGTNQTLCRLALSRAVTRAVGDQVAVVVGTSSGIGRARQALHHEDHRAPDSRRGRSAPARGRLRALESG